MIQIRKGMFETNSSSVHSFVITKNDKLDIPKIVSNKFMSNEVEDNLGWYSEDEPKPTLLEKLKFFYDAAVKNNKEKEFLLYLKSKNITIKSFPIEKESFIYESTMFDTYDITEDDLDKIIFGKSTKYYHNATKKIRKDKNQKLVELFATY